MSRTHCPRSAPENKNRSRAKQKENAERRREYIAAKSRRRKDGNGGKSANQIRRDKYKKLAGTAT